MLCVPLQNVLGKYADYQSALDKMDLNEQMKYLVGVAESTHSAATCAKPTASIGHAPVTGRMTVAAVANSQLPAPHSSRKEKCKKTHRDASKKPAVVDASSSAPRLAPSNFSRTKRKRDVIRGSSVVVVKDADKPCPVLPKERRLKTPPPPPLPPHIVANSKPTHFPPDPSPVSVLPRDALSGDKSQAPEAQNAISRTKREKKVRKKNSPPRVRHGSHPVVRPVGELPLLSSLPRPPPDQMKQRPEALCLPGHGSLHVSVPSKRNIGQGHPSDPPDTGDVQHMLDELLHPPSLSLVTPIPTPNTFTPFVFPAQSPAVQVSLNG